MNKAYRLIWSRHQQTLVAVSEVTRSSGKSSSRGASKFAFPTAMLLLGLGVHTPLALAACPADGGGVFRVTTGETCAAAQSSYSGSSTSPNSALIVASGTGSVINLTAPAVDVSNVGYGSLRVQNGGVINVLGSISANSTWFNSRTLWVGAGQITINGDLTASRTGDSQGAVIQTAGGNISVLGNTILNATLADGLRTFAPDKANFVGSLTITARDYQQGIYNTGTTIIGGALRISATNLINAGISMVDGRLSVGSDAAITTNAGIGVNQSGGAVEIAENADILASGTYGVALRQSAGSFQALGLNSQISATGTGGTAIHNIGGVVAIGTNASNVPANTNAVLVEAGEISSQSGYGILAEDSAKNVLVRLGSPADVISGGASAIQINNTGSGTASVTTAGDVAASNGTGIRVYNGSSAGNLTIEQTAGSITGTTAGIATSNDGAGATTITTAATVSASAVSGNGISATQNGSGALLIEQTAGSISNTLGSGSGILASLGAANTGGATILQAAGATISGSYGIRLDNAGAGATTITTAGTITGGTVAGIQTSGTAGNSVAINLLSGADVSATSGVAIRDDAGNATVDMASGAKLTGQVLLGNGNDAMIIHGGAEISAVTLLDGGNSTDGTVTDILGTAGAATNKLTFDGATYSLAGSLMKNWQSVTLDNSHLTFSGDSALVTGTGLNPDSSRQGLNLINASTLTSPIALAVTGDVYIDPTSTLNHALGGSITGNVTNAGLIYWGNLGQTLLVGGNYVGVPGSRLSLETVLGDDNSLTDRMHVTGNTSGSTALEIRNVGGTGAQTVNGINVVQVDGASAAGSFTLAAPVQAGAYEYALRQGSALDANDWYLFSYMNNTQPGNTNNIPLYRPGVVNYVAGQQVNAEQGLIQLSTMHQRIGSQVAIDEQGKRTWLRPYAYWQSADGKERFDYSSRITGVQFGHELMLQRSETGATTRAALTLDYAASDADFTDGLRPQAGLDKHTGTLSGHSVAIGGTYTRQDAEGGYLDLVAQISSLRNGFEDRYGDDAKQKGWRTALSVEAGKPIARFGNWQLEPQGQLVYMHTRYDGFADATSQVDGYSANFTRGRLGMRLFMDKLGNDGGQAYGIVNLLHDFSGGESVNVGGTNVREHYSRTRAELGIGMQHAVTKSGYLYGDARYQHALDGREATGYQLNIGFRLEM